MKNREKLYVFLASIALILSISISALSIAAASSEENNPVIVTETQITASNETLTSESSQSSPVIYSSKVEWHYNNSTDNGSVNSVDVYESNFYASRSVQIVSNEEDGWLPDIDIVSNESDHFWPFISSDSVIWDIPSDMTAWDNWFNEFVNKDFDSVFDSDDWFNNFLGDELHMNAFDSNLQEVDFSASPTSGEAPLRVAFTDESAGSSTSWEWDFGDGTNSTEQNPVHTYNSPGRYTVTLTEKNDTYCGTKTVFEYIQVS